MSNSSNSHHHDDDNNYFWADDTRFRRTNRDPFSKDLDTEINRLQALIKIIKAFIRAAWVTLLIMGIIVTVAYLIYTW